MSSVVTFFWGGNCPLVIEGHLNTNVVRTQFNWSLSINDVCVSRLCECWLCSLIFLAPPAGLAPTLAGRTCTGTQTVDLRREARSSLLIFFSASFFCFSVMCIWLDPHISRVDVVVGARRCFSVHLWIILCPVVVFSRSRSFEKRQRRINWNLSSWLLDIGRPAHLRLNVLRDGGTELFTSRSLVLFFCFRNWK